MEKRTFVIGDVHGELSALKTLISSLHLRDTDQLIFLGDLVDKGPNTRETLDYLIDLSTKIDCKFVRGNHEELMLAAVVKKNKRAQDIWMRHGGRMTLNSYGLKRVEQAYDYIPMRHIDFLKSTIDACITDNHIFVHAGWNTKKNLYDQEPKTLRYQFMNASKPDHKFGKTIVCGHSSLMSGKPARKGNILCIDTIEYGWLTAYQVETGRFHQANAFGKTRMVKRAEKFTQKRHVPKEHRI